MQFKYLLTILTASWIYAHWLSYANTTYRCDLQEEPLAVLKFPNMETFAILQAQPGITVEVALERQMQLTYDRAQLKYTMLQLAEHEKASKINTQTLWRKDSEQE